MDLVDVQNHEAANGEGWSPFLQSTPTVPPGIDILGFFHRHPIPSIQLSALTLVLALPLNCSLNLQRGDVTLTIIRLLPSFLDSQLPGLRQSKSHRQSPKIGTTHVECGEMTGLTQPQLPWNGKTSVAATSDR